MDIRTKWTGFLAALILVWFTGCATQSARTVKTETTQYSTQDDERAAEPVKVEKQTTETTESNKTSSESTGIVSGAVHATGEILALPFRAVGGLIRVIF